MTTQSLAMQKDPVCGMQLDPNQSTGTSLHGGKTYHFCSAGCKTKFDKSPHDFTGKEHSNGSGCCCGSK
jgi:Cu+-exporting ATPase